MNAPNWNAASGAARSARKMPSAQAILMLAQGDSFTTITATVGCYPDYINRWKQRFEAERLPGLRAKCCRQPPTVRTPAMEARILAKTPQRPPDGSRHWSTRKFATVLGVSHVLVARVWRRTGLQPHRLERYMLADDPAFEQKAADVIGLYLHPPQHAVVFAVGEKTAIQALDRLDPVFPLSPGRAERHGFEYYQHGTLSLHAALNTRTGEILGHTVPRRTSDAFVDFLTDIKASQPRGREIHVIVDNLSAHKTKKVQAFLDAHPRVHLHFTPTYSSWLNQLELWFAKVERDRLARGIFTLLPDFGRQGSPAIWVPDNLKSGVTTANRYEPEINRTYAELARTTVPSSFPRASRRRPTNPKSRSVSRSRSGGSSRRCGTALFSPSRI